MISKLSFQLSLYVVFLVIPSLYSMDLETDAEEPIITAYESATPDSDDESQSTQEEPDHVIYTIIRRNSL